MQVCASLAALNVLLVDHLAKLLEKSHSNGSTTEAAHYHLRKLASIRWIIGQNGQKNVFNVNILHAKDIRTLSARNVKFLSVLRKTEIVTVNFIITNLEFLSLNESPSSLIFFKLICSLLKKMYVTKG